MEIMIIQGMEVKALIVEDIIQSSFYQMKVAEKSHNIKDKYDAERIVLGGINFLLECPHLGIRRRAELYQRFMEELN